jgi:hypothetical protein
MSVSYEGADDRGAAALTRAAQLRPVSRHRMESFPDTFIPGIIGMCGGIEP